jgi:hypothetical protein
MLDPIRGKDRRAEHRFAECPSDRRTFEHPNLDESSQDAVSSLEVLLRCRPDPLRYHIANDPGSGTKSVGVENAQGSVLGSEPAPEAMLALASGNIQRHRHELKFNWLSRPNPQTVELYSRSASRVGRRFPLLCRVLRELPVRSTIIDGEVVASDAQLLAPRADRGCNLRPRGAEGCRPSF